MQELAAFLLLWLALVTVLCVTGYPLGIAIVLSIALFVVFALVAIAVG